MNHRGHSVNVICLRPDRHERPPQSRKIVANSKSSGRPIAVVTVLIFPRAGPGYRGPAPLIEAAEKGPRSRYTARVRAQGGRDSWGELSE